MFSRLLLITITHLLSTPHSNSAISRTFALRDRRGAGYGDRPQMRRQMHALAEKTQNMVGSSREEEVMDGFAEFGWRGRIGYIVAIPVIEHMPYEFYQMAPKGVGIVITSLGKKDQGAEETEKALGRLDQAIADLAAVGADYICVASSPMVTYRGPGADREIISQIRKIAKVPGSTTTTVAMDALKFFGAQRIVLVSPYASQNEKVKVFLEAEGFKVLHAKGLEAKLTAIGRLPGSLAYRLA